MSNTEYVVNDEKAMVNKLVGTLLADPFAIRQVNTYDIPICVIEEGPKNWRPGVVGRKPKVQVEAVIFKKYTSYVIVSVDGYRIAIPIDGNGTWFYCLCTVRQFAIGIRKEDFETKGTMEARTVKVKITENQSREIYRSLTLFADKEMIVQNKLDSAEHVEHVLSRLGKVEQHTAEAE